ncbi:MAG: alkaline phosphatase [Microbacterium hominis]|nr:alkaline phosphatase [Microbacterium hominis]
MHADRRHTCADSFITDSANSATALMAGHKSTVNALNSYTDSTGSAFGNAKFETVFEMARRIYNSKIGIVSTAYLADATPAAVVTHTSQRSQYAYIIRQFLNGLTSEFPWTRWDGPDVRKSYSRSYTHPQQVQLDAQADGPLRSAVFGGGGSDFIPNSKNNKTSFIDGFVDKGYQFTTTNASLEQLDDNKRALGLFAASNLPTWLDRHVFTDNLKTFGAWNATAKNFTGPVVDTPGLKEMTIKAVNILQKRSQADNTNFLLMSEAASIDKAMHIGDYQSTRVYTGLYERSGGL